MSTASEQLPFTVLYLEEATQTGPGYEPRSFTLIIYRTPEGSLDQLILDRVQIPAEEIHKAIKKRLGVP